MGEAIVVALISGGLTLIGVLIANSKAQAVTETRLDELTREVRKHNGFAEKIPEIRGDIRLINEQIKVANHRIDDLEEESKR